MNINELYEQRAKNTGQSYLTFIFQLRMKQIQSRIISFMIYLGSKGVRIINDIKIQIYIFSSCHKED